MKVLNLKAVSIAILIFLSIAIPCTADILVNKYAAENAKYDCPVPKDINDIKERALRLHQHSYDKNKLGCAADLMYEVAKRTPNNIDIQINAIAFHNDYLVHVNTLNDYDIIGINNLEWMARTEKASQQVHNIIKRAMKTASDNAAVLTLRAIAEVQSTRLMLGPEEAVAITKDAMELLKQAVAIDPNVLNGLPMIVLGRMYYELPSIYGGDTLKAIELLEHSLKDHPTNIQLRRFLAEGYDQELEEAKAKAVLKEMNNVAEPMEAERQLYADEFRAGIGIAERLGDLELRDQLTNRRKALLDAHPELLTRFIEAHAGHFGEHPLTGERDY